MGNFTQATPPPSARAAPDALKSAELLAEIQKDMYEAQKEMARTLQEASESLGKAIKDSGEEESKTMMFQSAGMIAQGATQGAAEGVNAFQGMREARDPKMEAAHKELDVLNGWEKGLTNLQNRPGETIRAQRDGNPDPANVGVEEFKKADIRKPFPGENDPAAVQAGMAHAVGHESFTAKLQSVRDAKKAKQKEIDAFQSGAQQAHSKRSAWGMAASYGGNGILGTVAAQHKFDQALTDQWRQAAQTQTDAVKQAYEQTGQNAHKIDDQKDATIRTLQQGLADANRA